MREGDDLYFAPGIRFSKVDLDGEALPGQLAQRIRGYLLDPARLCLESRHAFAAGLILVSTVDFLAGLHHDAESLNSRGVGADFRLFVRRRLQSFTGDLHQRFYDEFRNGLSHEARIKNAGEFSFDWPHTVRLAGGRMCINPRYLLAEVETALELQTRELEDDGAARAQAAQRIRVLFASELGIVAHASRAG